MFAVTAGTPHENQMHFCTYCGKHLEQHIYMVVDFDDVADAARYRRLAWLVDFGMWSVGKHVIEDSYGRTDDRFMDDKSEMDVWLDRPDVIADADDCARALSFAKEN